MTVLSLVILTFELRSLTEADWSNKTEKVVLFYTNREEPTTAEAMRSFG